MSLNLLESYKKSTPGGFLLFLFQSTCVPFPFIHVCTIMVCCCSSFFQHTSSRSDAQRRNDRTRFS